VYHLLLFLHVRPENQATMTGVALCQKKFGDPWFSLCNTVFTRLSEPGEGGGGVRAVTEKWGPRGPRRMLAPVKTRDV